MQPLRTAGTSPKTDGKTCPKFVKLTDSSCHFLSRFKTGDVVELIGARQIRIIDRVKNFFKLSQGEFVTPESVENVYAQSPFVFQCLVTHADLTKFEQNAVSAVVVPHEKTVLTWANSIPLLKEFKTLAQIVSDSNGHLELQKKILEEIVKVAHKNHLRLFEVRKLCFEFFFSPNFLTVLE